MSRFNLKVGPFTSGMNNRDVDLHENQMRQITNMEITPTGSLRLRRPFNRIEIVPEAQTNVDNKLLGNIVDSRGTKQYAVVINNGILNVIGVGTDYLDFTVKSLGTIPNPTSVDDWKDLYAIFSYGSKYWLMGRNLDSYWTDILPDIDAYDDTTPVTWTKITTGPIDLGGKIHGDAFAIYKDRLFVATQTRIYWSRITEFDKWDIVVDDVNSSGFVRLGSGEGEIVNFMCVLNGNLYIFSAFRTYALHFEDEGVPETLKQVNNQGATTGCFWRDRLFTLSELQLYEYNSELYFLKNFTVNILDTGIVTGMVAVDDGIIISFSTGEVYLYYPLFQSFVEFDFSRTMGTNQYYKGRSFYPNTITIRVRESQFSYTILSDSEGRFYAIPFNYHTIYLNDFYDRNEILGQAFLYDFEIITGTYDAQNPHMVKVLSSGYIVGNYQDQLTSSFIFFGLKENSKVTSSTNVGKFVDIQHFVTPDKRARVIEFGMGYSALPPPLNYVLEENRTNRYFNLQYFLVDVTMLQESAVEQGLGGM